ncbi:hypothetical protein WME94_55630 [Sorangium sp. So ce429]
MDLAAALEATSERDATEMQELGIRLKEMLRALLRYAFRTPRRDFLPRLWSLSSLRLSRQSLLLQRDFCRYSLRKKAPGSA